MGGFFNLSNSKNFFNDDDKAKIYASLYIDLYLNSYGAESDKERSMIASNIAKK